MGTIVGLETTFARMSQTQVTEDLPATAASPLEIDCSGTKICQVAVYVDADFFWTWAASQTSANTRITSDTTRCKWPKGFYTFDCMGNSDKLYVKSQGAGATTDGIAYTLIEGA